jgi:predicted small metal-binding protein
MEKEFQVYGRITIDVELDVIASSEEEAIKQAIQSIKDGHHLDVIGADIQGSQVDYTDLSAIEYEDEE